jgi:hypothetical protein
LFLLSVPAFSRINPKMSEAPPAPAAGGGGRGGFGRGDGRGRGRGRGGRGRGGRGGRGGRDDENVWMPVTKLGRLVKEGKIGSLEEIFLFSLPVKEAEIIEFFLKDKLLDEVMKVRALPSDPFRSGCIALRTFSHVCFFHSLLVDHACPEAVVCRSAYSFQGLCCCR